MDRSQRIKTNHDSIERIKVVKVKVTKDIFKAKQKHRQMI